MIGLTSLLQANGDDLTPEQAAAVDMIAVSGDLLLRVVNDVLDYTKLTVGMVDISKEETLLHPLLRQAVDASRVKAQQRGINIQMSLAKNLPLYVFTDGKRLSQILLNLLGNAVKFSDDGGVIELNVFRGVTKSGNPSLRIDIKDYGMGIEKENFAKIFDPFQQANAETEKSYGGTGLGLTISSQLAKALGGDISVDTATGNARGHGGQSHAFNFQISHHAQGGPVQGAHQIICWYQHVVQHEFGRGTGPHAELVLDLLTDRKARRSLFHDKLGNVGAPGSGAGVDQKDIPRCLSTIQCTVGNPQFPAIQDKRAVVLWHGRCLHPQHVGTGRRFRHGHATNFGAGAQIGQPPGTLVVVVGVDVQIVDQQQGMRQNTETQRWITVTQFFVHHGHGGRVQTHAAKLVGHRESE